MAPKTDVYTVVTDRIIAALEAGTVPWRKPWRSIGGVQPTSLSTGKPYRGINSWILSLESMTQGYVSPYWVTFKQAQARGGSVRRGEKGTQVVLWKPMEKVDPDTGETKRTFLLRYFTVFNTDQCDGVDTPEIQAAPEDRVPIDEAEQLVRSWTSRPEISHGGNRACYSPLLDKVSMPQSGQFNSDESYYVTLFHELAHSTGHPSRLARTSLVDPKPFGSEDYSKEELIAEMASAYLCAEVGIENDLDQSAAYIASWLKVLKNDRKLLVDAAAAAQKATDLVTEARREQQAAETELVAA